MIIIVHNFTIELHKEVAILRYNNYLTLKIEISNTES